MRKCTVRLYFSGFFHTKRSFRILTALGRFAETAHAARLQSAFAARRHRTHGLAASGIAAAAAAADRIVYCVLGRSISCVGGGNARAQERKDFVRRRSNEEERTK